MKKKFPFVKIIIISLILAAVDGFWIANIDAFYASAFNVLFLILNPIFYLPYLVWELGWHFTYTSLLFIYPLFAFIQNFLLISLFVFFFRKIREIGKERLKYLLYVVLFSPILIWIVLALMIFGPVLFGETDHGGK